MQNKKQLLMNELYDELVKLNNLVLEVRKDFLLGEATTAEYASYVSLCIKRLNILIKVFENLNMDMEDDCVAEFIELKNKLEPALLQMKNHAGTATNTNAQITCNVLLKSFKERFGKYLTEEELEDAVTI